jgi:predicted nucleotidyltransferase component of viral defense system
MPAPRPGVAALDSKDMDRGPALREGAATLIDRRELLLLAENLGLQPQVVEKDYVLGWLLAGIRDNADLGDHWVFKGGTCLKKCYLETYRFSEDLDFTIINEAHLDQAFLTKAFSDISAWIYEQTGLEIPADRLRFDVFRNKRERLACEGRIYYRGPIAPRGGDLPRIRLDLTTDEVLALPPVERPVVHSFSDEPEGGIKALCYAYEEVFGEKVRALGERARPRDLYDVVNLFRHEEFQPQPAAILDVLKRKCAYKGIQCRPWIRSRLFMKNCPATGRRCLRISSPRYRHWHPFGMFCRSSSPGWPAVRAPPRCHPILSQPGKQFCDSRSVPTPVPA